MSDAPAFIRIDLFPAEVTGIERATRAVVTDSRYYFYVDSPDGPAIERTGVLRDFDGSPKVGYTVVDDDTGETIGFHRSSGCGCGSRLRGFRPFPGVPQQARY